MGRPIPVSYTHLWKSGHAGVYIGGGYAIEAMGTSKGVVKTKVSDPVSYTHLDVYKRQDL